MSEAEWERARRFVFRRDRNRFVAAHAALREMLSAQCGIPASLLEFDHGPFGKPALVEHAGLRFNLSHSGPLALVASASGGRDRRRRRDCCGPCPTPRLLAESYFTQDE